MRQRMERILQRHGIAMNVCHQGQISQVRAFFQPVITRIAREISTPLGMAPQGKYHYFGPAQQPVAVGDEILLDDQSYFVVRAEEVRDEKGIVYRWAVCKQRGGKDTWVRPI